MAVISDLDNSSLSEVLGGKSPIKVGSVENVGLISSQEPLWGLMRGTGGQGLGRAQDVLSSRLGLAPVLTDSPDHCESRPDSVKAVHDTVHDTLPFVTGVPKPGFHAGTSGSVLGTGL